MTESVLINRRTYDHASSRVDIMGLPIRGYVSVDYDDELDIGEGRGASQVPLATTRGKYKPDKFKISVHRSTGEEMRQYIAAKSRTGKSLGSVVGTNVVQYIDDLLGVQTITMRDCRVTKPGTGATKEGSDPDMEAWEFYVRLLDRNGITLYESDEEGA